MEGPVTTERLRQALREAPISPLDPPTIVASFVQAEALCLIVDHLERLTEALESIQRQYHNI